MSHSYFGHAEWHFKHCLVVSFCAFLLRAFFVDFQLCILKSDMNYGCFECYFWMDLRIWFGVNMNLPLLFAVRVYVIVCSYLGCEHRKCAVVCVSMWMLICTNKMVCPMDPCLWCNCLRNQAPIHTTEFQLFWRFYTRLNKANSNSFQQPLFGNRPQGSVHTHTPCFYLFVSLSLRESSQNSQCLKLNLMRSSYRSHLRRWVLSLACGAHIDTHTHTEGLFVLPPLQTTLFLPVTGQTLERAFISMCVSIISSWCLFCWLPQRLVR